MKIYMFILNTCSTTHVSIFHSFIVFTFLLLHIPINLFIFERNYCCEHFAQVLLHNTLVKGKKCLNIEKPKKMRRGRHEKNLRIISIVLFMCYSPIHIIHYDFYYFEGTWRTKRRREKKIFFRESRLLQVTNLLSALHIFFLSLSSVFFSFVWFSPARYKSKYLYVDLSMFYFVICCGAFGALEANKLLWLFSRSELRPGVNKKLSMKTESLWNFS